MRCTAPLGSRAISVDGSTPICVAKSACALLNASILAASPGAAPSKSSKRWVCRPLSCSCKRLIRSVVASYSRRSRMAPCTYSGDLAMRLSASRSAFSFCSSASRCAATSSRATPMSVPSCSSCSLSVSSTTSFCLRSSPGSFSRFATTCCAMPGFCSRYCV